MTSYQRFNFFESYTPRALQVLAERRVIERQYGELAILTEMFRTICGDIFEEVSRAPPKMAKAGIEYAIFSAAPSEGCQPISRIERAYLIEYVFASLQGRSFAEIHSRQN